MNAGAPRRSLAAHLMGSTFLAIAVVVALLPIALVLMNAFKPHSEIIGNPLAWPIAPTTGNFRSAWVGAHFTSGLGNSILICASTILVTISCAALAAYPLARRRVRFWQLISLYFLCAVTVPIQLFLFPLFYRALEDNGYPRDISGKAIGDTWLNYIVEDKTVLLSQVSPMALPEMSRG